MGSADWLADAWSWIAASTLQATLLCALVWMAERLLVRRVWAELLVLAWLCALVRAFLPPGLASPLSVTRALGEPTLAAAAESTPSANWLAALGYVWLAGCALLLATRALQRRRLATRFEPVALPHAWSVVLARAERRLRRPRRVRVATLSGLGTPAVFGLRRPTLLLPRGWLQRAPERADELALLHELMHLERGDLWLDEACACVRALLWFQPLAWLAVRRIHVLSELACDQRVARLLGRRAPDYRAALLRTARELAAHPEVHPVRGFLREAHALVLRIELLERRVPRAPAVVRAAGLALALLLAACVLPMASTNAALRVDARRAFAAGQRGERLSCFTLHAAAMVLAAEPPLPGSRD